MHVPRNERSNWNSAVSDSSRDRLKTAVAAWYGASALSRDAFRSQFFNPYTSDEIVDRLRSAAQGMVEGTTYDTLAKAGKDLAAAAQKVGVDRWPRFLGDAGHRAVAAVSAGRVPGVVKVGGADTTATLAVLGGLIVGIAIYHATRPNDATPASNQPLSVQQSPPEIGKEELPGATPAILAKPGEATLADDRRKYILDGNGRGGGGHGPNRGTPKKSEFPSDWSDEKTTGAIVDVANDPASDRVPADGERTAVRGTRDGVDIEVIIGRDRKTIITAYPTSVTPNGEQ